MRVALGVLFIILTGPVLLIDVEAGRGFGSAMRNIGLSTQLPVLGISRRADGLRRRRADDLWALLPAGRLARARDHARFTRSARSIAAERYARRSARSSCA